MNTKIDISLDNDNNYYVYKHIRKDNGDVFYVGYGNRARPYTITSRNHKWKELVSKIGGFFVEVFDKPMNKEDALKFEAKAIAKYDAITPLTNKGQNFSLLPVVCYDKLHRYVTTFENRIEAAKHVDSKELNIHNACKHQFRLHKGFYWRYYENMGSLDYDKVIKKSKSKIYTSVVKTGRKVFSRYQSGSNIVKTEKSTKKTNETYAVDRGQFLTKIKSDYKCVYSHKKGGYNIFWAAEIYIDGVKKREIFSRLNGKCAESERAAAKWVDLQLIRAGKEPVNILKRK